VEVLKAPLKVHAGLDEVLLADNEDVRAKVASVSVAWGYPLGGGVWSLQVPLAVVDRRHGGRRWAPVIDANLALAVALMLLGAMAALRRRRSARDGRREHESAAE
jgi:hypothetical protein